MLCQWNRCGQVFDTALDLWIHMEQCHIPPSRYKCSSCSIVLGTCQQAYVHAVSQHEEVKEDRANRSGALVCFRDRETRRYAKLDHTYREKQLEDMGGRQTAEEQLLKVRREKPGARREMMTWPGHVTTAIPTGPDSPRGDTEFVRKVILKQIQGEYPEAPCLRVLTRCEPVRDNENIRHSSD
ncbi:hypothetical protein An08g11700 [Aspergillus niger]|uniref:C2H2-type domain-containing protein n=2 Tax=Aspergillus niger TaxID=5061 RepID=A2QSR8_ASPNC|nr:hypothetical protein An08g11700 [Aspergillus niger]CAK96790.1 hypothetical protein An08g11700 [Aspergillus niger]